VRVKVINKRPASVLQKKRVCAYARVSTDSRRQEDSLENQMETYERLITGNPKYEFIGVFADQGISGYCENRPQFQRMMEKARAGEIDLIITKSISRFARNTVTVLKCATPENKRNHTRKNNGEVQSYYISENHEPIVSPEVWEKVQEVREQRKRDRNIGQDSTMKFQNRYPLSGMLICPYCGKTLRRRQV
jgi:predicted site-specific integrase-resolvase